MNLSILSAVFSSAVFTTILGFILNNISKKREYNYDYKKYILQKRKVVYDKIEDLLNQLEEHKIVTVEGKKHKDYPDKISKIFDYTEGENPLSIFNRSLVSAAENTLWLSDELQESLNEMNKLLLSIIVPFKSKNSELTQTALFLLYVENFQEFNRIRLKIRKHFFKDLISLNDIDNFRKNKKV